MIASVSTNENDETDSLVPIVLMRGWLVLMRGWLVLLAAGCVSQERSPEGAVRAFIEATVLQDRAEVYRLLGPTTRARLEERSKRAAEMAGNRAVLPEELLAAGWGSPAYKATEIHEIERDKASATVEVSGPHNERDRVRCVRVGAVWRIELP